MLIHCMDIGLGRSPSSIFRKHKSQQTDGLNHGQRSTFGGEHGCRYPFRHRGCEDEEQPPRLHSRRSVGTRRSARGKSSGTLGRRIMPKPINWKATNYRWHDIQTVPAKSYRCGYCGDQVTSEKGYPFRDRSNGRIGPGVVVCPQCSCPTFVYPESGSPFPSAPFGAVVKHVPSEVASLYAEARDCAAQGSHTACVLICRKLLMHISVAQGAAAGLTFMAYVEHLSASGYVPPNGKHWVDHIRKKGNEANHEIVIMGDTEAKELLGFIEMLLRFIYEFPNAIPKP